MTTAADHDEGSRFLKVVEAIAISPAEAQALVRSHQESFRRRHPGAADGQVRDTVSNAIVRRYARLAATSGGVTALAGVIPGVGTALAMLGGGLAGRRLLHEAAGRHGSLPGGGPRVGRDD